MDLIKTLTAQYMKPELPAMRVGDTVRVTVRVNEGNRERTQAFEGTIIAKKHGGINETITVRRISYGVGCEKVSRCTLPRSCPSIPFAAAKSAEPSCTTCATAWAREPRSKSLSKWILQKKRLRPLFLHFQGVFTIRPEKNSHNFSCRKRV